MFNTGDEVVCKNNDYFDILTILNVDQQMKEVTCFEYDMNDSYVFSFDEVEKLGWKAVVDERT